MASKFGYWLTKRAESDLDGIVSYIAVELVDPQATTEDLGGDFGCIIPIFLRAASNRSLPAA